jgi:hypothetical protein
MFGSFLQQYVVEPTAFVRFQVLTAVSMKVFVFWVVASCNLGDHHPDDGDNKHF